MSLVAKLKKSAEIEESSEPTTATVTLRFEQDLNRRFEAAATKLGKSKNWVMTHLVEQFCAESESERKKG